jgi:hypothetical protein
MNIVKIHIKHIQVLAIAMFLVFALTMQFGCKKVKDDTLPDVTASTYTINGIVKVKEPDGNGIRLVSWPYGPAMIRAGKLANAALSSDGTFSLILPATIKGSEFTTMDDFTVLQGGTCQAVPANSNFAGPIEFTVDYSDNGEAKNMVVGQYLYVLNNNKPVISKSYTYNFYDTEGAFSGSSYYGTTFNWSCLKGWGIF